MPKYLTLNAIKGQTGINIVEEAVLGMGFKWSAGNASLDTGIDGDIELVDPATREAKNVLIRAQVKARVMFDKEDESSFEFTCSKQDIDYWLGGNAPVILIVVRLDKRMAWWKSLRDSFSDPVARKRGKLVFDKIKDRFDAKSGPALLALAQQYGAGVYVAPRRRRERLISNLLPITRLPPCFYMAETPHRDPVELRDVLKQHVEWPDREWILTDGCIYSVHNLRDEPWCSVCDIGTVERIETEEWASSESSDIRHRFVRLLNKCLAARIAPLGLVWNKEEECYYFKACVNKETGELRPREVAYTSLRQSTKRTVFRIYRSTKEPDTIAYCRHVGFQSRFHFLDGTWYLEITPRYVFTTDGREPHPFREEYQSKIKTIEGGAAVRNIVVMFASLLEDQTGLFVTPYRYLGFGELADAEVDVGIDDELWAKKDELQPSSQTELEEVEPGLFAE